MTMITNNDNDKAASRQQPFAHCADVAQFAAAKKSTLFALWQGGGKGMERRGV